MNLAQLQLTPEEQLDGIKAGLAEVFRGSLYKTAKHLCGFKQMTRRTHGEVVQALESNTLRKLLVLPRGTFKSSIGVVAYPLWLLINNPNLRILIDSEVYGNSKNFLREIKSVIQSERFIEIFGDWKTLDNWNEGEITISKRTKAFKEASITCGGIGTIKVGQHYDVIIGDDYNSGNNSETIEGRKKVIKHYQMNLAILEPNGTYVIIGTRYASDDVIGWILENEVA